MGNAPKRINSNFSNLQVGTWDMGRLYSHAVLYHEVSLPDVHKICTESLGVQPKGGVPLTAEGDLT
jgi:hypothetical protein